MILLDWLHDGNVLTATDGARTLKVLQNPDGSASWSVMASHGGVIASGSAANDWDARQIAEAASWGS